MSTKCGLTYTLSYLLFIKLGRGLGGGPEIGGGGGQAGGGGCVMSVFNMQPITGSFFSV
jgi:hypothetical protein